jgi:tRNA(Ile)-lysidine synthase
VKELLRLAGIPPWLRGQVPILESGGQIVAVGDWHLAPEFKARLEQSGLRLVWQPGEPALALAHHECS